MPCRIEAILFDFGGTLDHDGFDWFDRFYRDIKKYDAALTRESFMEHSNWVSRHVGTLADTAGLNLADMVARLYKHLHARMSNGDPCAWDHAVLAQAFVAEAQTYLRRNLLLLQILRQHYRIGVISNNWGNAAGWCEDYGYSDLCECMVDSTVVGAAKPDARIFQAALEQMQLPPQACAYVGDKFEADVIGAAGIGMTPIWLVGAEDKPCPNDSLPAHRLRQLTQLETLTL